MFFFPNTVTLKVFCFFVPKWRGLIFNTYVLCFLFFIVQARPVGRAIGVSHQACEYLV